MTGKKRHIEAQLLELMQQFPCVAILGPRQVGKTTLIKKIVPNAQHFDLERRSDFTRISGDPDFFLSQHKETISIDEAQLCPDLFPALRVAIDERRNKKGQYLISGSSSPELLHHISESLAGRVAMVYLGGLQGTEIESLLVSQFYSLVSTGKNEKLLNLKKPQDNETVFQNCLFGGYPEPTLRRDEGSFYERWMQNYIDTYLKRDIRSLFPKLSLETYEKFIEMLTTASGQLINASNFARSLDVAQPTIKNYIRIANGTFIWRSIPSYEKNVTKRVSKMPKGHYRDSGLLCHMLNISSTEALMRHQYFGFIWESFVTEQILVGFENQQIRVQPYYYRTQNQAEVDLVLEGRFGIVPVEIKAGFVTERKKLRALSDFIEEHDCPYGLVINNSEAPAMLAPKIYQIPAGCL